jgi:hypothetical protein
MNYERKYLKYKNKYLSLKKLLGGDSWTYIVREIKAGLAEKKSVGFHVRYPLDDVYGCIFNIEDIKYDSWKIKYVSIKDNSIREMYIGSGKSADKFEIVKRGYMPGATLETGSFMTVSKGDSNAVKETWRIADEQIPK